MVQLRAGRDGGGLRRLVKESGVGDEAAIDVIEEALEAPAFERLEHELYEPFRDWLIQELDTETFAFAEAVVTARARRQGRWTQPDVCQLTVTNFEYVPGATVELSSFELKRRADVRKLESVYEAAAHGRFAHRANLVLEVESRDSVIEPEIVKDAERFGLGLYKLWFTGSDRVSVQRQLTSRLLDPEAADLDDMIGVVLDQLGTNAKKKSFRQALKF